MLSSLSAVAADVFQAVEPVLWVAYFVALLPVGARAVRRIVREGQLHQLLGVIAVAAAVRLLAPWEPIYWHYPLMNLRLGDELYTRHNSYLPYILRLLVFEQHGGFDAALAFNLIAGTASIPLLWCTALMAGHSPRVSMLFGALIAITPMYVRQSASDGVYITILLLYASAAIGFATLSAERYRRSAAALVVSSVLLGMPIRGESAIVYSSIPLFWLHGSAALKDLLKPRRANIVLAISCIAGAIVVHHLQQASLGERAHFDGTSFLFGVITQTLGVMSPLFFPPLITVPIWLMTWHLLRERKWRNVLSIHLPIWVGRVPHLFGCAFMLSLADSGYHILSVIFILLASARGLSFLYLRHLQGRFMPDPWRWRAAISAGAAALALWCFTGYSWRGIEGQEMRFLHAAFPREPSTILVIWDPDPTPGDDCCLSQPYPPLWAEMPRTRWIVLHRSDLDRPEYIRSLRFDFYFPGSMVQLEDSTNWYTRDRHSSDDEKLRQQAEGLREIRLLDALVRQTHRLEPWRTATIRGHTPSFAHFPDDTVTLTVYRNTHASAAGVAGSG